MNTISQWITLELEVTPFKNNFYEEFKEFIDSNKEGYTINWSINYLIPGMYTPKSNNKQSGNDDWFIPIFASIHFLK